RFSFGNDLEHRVRVHAIVTHEDAKQQTLYLQSDQEGIVAHLARPARFEPGSQVDIAGFVTLNQSTMILEEAIARRTGIGPSPAPVPLTAAGVIARKDDFAFAPASAMLVRMDGQLVERVPHAGGANWILRDGEHVFAVQIDRGVADRLSSIGLGSRLRVSGVCDIAFDRIGEPVSFSILTRSADDIEVLEARGWSRRSWLMAAALLLFLGLAAWLWMMRHVFPSRSSTAAENALAKPVEPLVGAARFCGIGAVLIGLPVLIGGWLLGSERLRSLLPGTAPMHALTAAGLALAGSALICASIPARPIFGVLRDALSTVIVALGVAAIAAFLLSGSFLTESMAQATALGFLLTGSSLLLAARRRSVVAAQILACVAAVLAFMNLVGFLYGVHGVLAAELSPIGMAPHTALAFGLLTAGILCLGSRQGLMAVASARAPGGVLARRLLPAIVIFPVLLGWVRWMAQSYGMFDSATGMTLFACANALVFGILIWANAGLLNRLDRARTDAEIRLGQMNCELEARVERRTADLGRANEELAAARTQIESVLDAATHVAIIATDTRGIIRLYNAGAQKMLGYDAAEIVGLETPERFHDPAELEKRSFELSSELGCPIEGFEILVADARGAGSDEREWTYVRKDGTRIEVRLTVTGVFNASGTLTGFLGVALDISARKKLERELRQNNQQLTLETQRAEKANRAKSEFLASMSHEIRTPMNSILGMSELLAGTNLDAEQRRYVEVFRRAGSSLLTLINDILDLSKIESGQFELEQVEFDLEEMIEETVDLLGGRARAKGLELLYRLPPEVPTSLVGDPARTRQVLINLMGNSIKFTETGQIVLAVALQEEESGSVALEFTVADTGIGIAADRLEAVFEDFAQADNSTAQKYGGTGLGLAISRRIAERMGGGLSAESKVGEGSTFRFAARYRRGTAVGRPLPPEAGELNGKKALIVDDNVTNRFILHETLLGWGMQADECANGFQALSFLAHGGYSMILIDSTMPGMSGFELAKKIRKLTPEVPVVILSSDHQPGDQALWRELGLAGFAVKPTRRSELLRILCGALHRDLTAPGPPDGARPQGTNSTSAPAMMSGRSLAILVADDSEDNQMLVQAYLKGTPHKLTFVDDGDLAVQQFAEGHNYDLVLMDVRMPKMDGMTATGLIRALEVQRHASPVRIFAVSANARPEDVQQSRRAGCDGHLSKPLSKQILLNAIDGGGASATAAAASVAEPSRGRSNSNSIQVAIHPLLADYVPGYLSARRKDAAQMTDLIERSDFDRLRHFGHNMKGTGAGYGLPELTRLGRELERAAIEHDSGALTELVATLNDHLGRVELVTQ
ncbi:MAG TPA: response regulator, partial [Bryobacteraceae bacterium]